jgi:uncharacterized membrane protein YtjA (UPF0391 family)
MADLTGVIPSRLPAPIWRPAPDFVPAITGFFVVSGPRAGRNICSSAGLFLRRGREVLRRADLETEIGNRGSVMLSWVVTFLIIALIAGILGFGGIAGVSIEIAKAIFFIAVVLFLVSAVVGVVRGRSRV